ncbi:MAG: hypothetical protein HUU20_14440 [Pirellulales bacterium]|nr:hypothetical protein [Pirellulales bacterium]
MSTNRERRLLWLGMFLTGLLSAVAGAAPWERLLTANRIEAAPDKEYRLTEEHGPWMILACSFSGDGAAEQARQLVLEIRKRYKLPAYMYEKTFDLTKDSARGGVDRFGEPLKTQYRRGMNFEEIAVLVGDYPAVDDPEAQETLRKLKYYAPECLKLEKDKPTAMNLAGLRLVQKYVLAPGNDKKKRGPMGHAFITTNPLLPDEYFVPKGLDPMVMKANEGLENCLLDCPGKYTVQVAHFTGKVVLKQQDIADIESGKRRMHDREDEQSGLAAAGVRAHNLTEALRKKGIEAYEFHDRYASIVTIGSFESVGTPRPDGKIEINPEIRAIIEQYKAKPQNVPGHPTGAMVPQTLAGIPFDVQPIPVMVPKRSISAAYARQATTGVWEKR